MQQVNTQANIDAEDPIIEGYRQISLLITLFKRWRTCKLKLQNLDSWLQVSREERKLEVWNYCHFFIRVTYLTSLMITCIEYHWNHKFLHWEPVSCRSNSQIEALNERLFLSIHPSTIPTNPFTHPPTRSPCHPPATLHACRLH